MKVRTMQEIGEALGVSKQMIYKYIKKGFLKKNRQNKIDVDDKYNRQFIVSKLAGRPTNLFTKYQDKPATKNEKVVESEGKENVILKLDLQLKLETLKNKQKDNELKQMKIQEQQGILIQKDLVEKLLFDTVGQVVQNLMVIPQTITDQIFSLIEEDNSREKVVSLLQKKYTEETKKIIENGYNKFKTEVKKRMIQASEEFEK